MPLPQVLGLVFGVIVFIAVLGGFVWLSKRVSGGQMLAGRRMRVVDRVMVSRDSSILLVQIGSRLLAVGSGKGSPSLLCEFFPSDFSESADKAGASPKTTGFWGRFVHNMKANVTGKAGAAPAGDSSPDNASSTDTSFAEVLRQIAEKNPPSGAENAGDAGYGCLREQQNSAPDAPAPLPDYQTSIDNMRSLGEPDNLDRRSRKRAAAPYSRLSEIAASPPPAAYRASSLKTEENSDENRGEQIDRVLDMIAKRQSRMDSKNDVKRT